MTPEAPAPDLLAAIVAATRHVVSTRAHDQPQAALERRAAEMRPRGGRFRSALERPGGINLIAECKRRSPLRGVLRADYDPAAIARAYAEAGAAAISVLTEQTFFDGEINDLRQVRAAVDLPVLRKDFILSEYQLIEARAAGADAALLIVAMLDDPLLRTLLVSAAGLGLAALVEVHSRAELDIALEGGAGIIGVNSRNLRTLDVDLDVLTRLAPHLPPGITRVAESGVKTTSDLEGLHRAGYHACLVGEALMTAADPGAALTALRAGGGG